LSGVRLAACAKPTKRALLSYLVTPLFAKPDHPDYFTHTTFARIHEMVWVLNEMGYTVDVIDYRDTSFRPKRRYDLFIGHKAVNFTTIASDLADDTVRIFFASESYWRHNNAREAERLAAFEKRHGVRLAPERRVVVDEDAALAAADGVIGMGNACTAETYAGFSPVIMLDGFSPADNTRQSGEKAPDRDFLFFSGSGAVHKGLDLLLDVFMRSEDHHLWICWEPEPAFLDVYAAELERRPNIHLMGRVRVRSEEFYSIIARCGFVILPSCSEGQSQALVECMNQGVVPVFSEACGLDGDCGIPLSDCSFATIEQTVRQLADMPPERYGGLSDKVRGLCRTRFTAAAFGERFATAVRDIVTRTGNSRRRP